MGRLKMPDSKMKDKSGTVEWNVWTGKCRITLHGWKMQDWKMQDKKPEDPEMNRLTPCQTHRLWWCTEPPLKVLHFPARKVVLQITILHFPVLHFRRPRLSYVWLFCLCFVCMCRWGAAHTTMLTLWWTRACPNSSVFSWYHRRVLNSNCLI